MLLDVWMSVLWVFVGSVNLVGVDVDIILFLNLRGL